MSRRSRPEPEHRPDSARSWATAAVAFAAMFVSVGTGFSYGSLVLPLTRDLGIGHGSASAVFAVTVMVFFLVGAPTGMLADRLGSRAVLLLGTVATGGGLALTATAQGAPRLFLGHGLLVGIGMSTTFVPLVALVGASFQRHRSIAVGVAVSGIGVGTLAMAPITAWLIDEYGWRRAYLVLAAAAGLVMLVCVTVLPRGRVGPPSMQPLGRTLRNREYRLLYGAQMLLAVAVFMPFAHLPAYAEESGSDPVSAAALVGVIGAASVAGRLALGPVADRVGLLRVYRSCYVAIGLSFSFWLWPGAPHQALLVHAVVFGIGYGGFVALLPAVVAERFGVQRLGGVLGVLYTANVLGAGAGPLVAGLLIQRHGYVPAAVGALCCGLAGAAVLARVGPGRVLASRE